MPLCKGGHEHKGFMRWINFAAQRAGAQGAVQSAKELRKNIIGGADVEMETQEGSTRVDLDAMTLFHSRWRLTT